MDLIFIFLFILIILTFSYSMYLGWINETIIETRNQDLNEIEKKNRQDCGKNTGYCFDDSDCTRKCINNGIYKCMAGVCTSDVILDQQVVNECDPKKGVIALLTGNPSIGTYESVCRSIDPGVANDDGTNNMCLNGQIDIDYFDKYPQISDCVCDYMVITDSTREMRPLAICTEKEIWEYFNLT